MYMISNNEQDKIVIHLVTNEFVDVSYCVRITQCKNVCMH